MGIFDKLKKGISSQKAEEKTEDADVATKEQAKKSEPAKEQKKTQKKTDAQPSATSSIAHAILLAPVLTEKSLRLQQDENKYTFSITQDANKIQVKQAIREVYGADPEHVHVIKQKARDVYRWGRKMGRSKAKKKAIVKMPKGTVLNLTQ